MKTIKVFSILCFLSLLASALYAQDTPESFQVETDETELLAENQEEENDAVEDQITSDDDTSDDKEDGQKSQALSPEEHRIEMEIKTSTLPELAVWCRSLGLSESGTRAELSRRLRQHYKLPDPAIAATSNRKIITIESAQTSEYFTIEVTDEEYARLSGDVKLNLIDGDAIHRISAEEILFNRTRSTLTASGKVIYEKESGSTIEIFRGENITVNIDDWSSIFLGGSSEHMMESDGAAYLFSGTVISHTSEDVTVLNKARITNAKNEEALWSINASKLWLLPGSDFAFVNAVLRVGEIPLFYLPFFYFPADEMIIHPVIGYRSREGGYVQTTTYIFGRPEADAAETSSIARILGDSNDMEKERHGLFLRSTGKKMTNPDKLSLKAMADYYVNMGAFFGLGLNVPKTGILNPLDFSAGLGLTRTVTLTGSGYTPYAPDYDGTSDWNQSNLFSFDVPFRYRMNLKSSVNTLFGGIAWDIPYYSDPYVERDFMNRSENMDWFNMMQGDTDDDTLENEISTYQWNVSGNLNVPVKALDPYISRISISNLSTSLIFRAIRDNDIFINNRDAPGRFFYAPDKYTIYNLSASVSGTPLTLGGQTAGGGTADPQVEDPFRGIGNPISPWDTNELDSINEILSDNKLIPPVLNQQFTVPSAGNVKFDIYYTMSPASASELQFMNGNWKTYDQVDWGEIRSILTSFGGSSNVNFRLNHSSGLFSNETTFSGNGTWRDYSYLNEEADVFLNSAGETDESIVESYRKQQYSQTNYSTSYANNVTVRPLYQNNIFSQSNLQYNFRGTLVRSRRYADGDGPELTPQWGAWVKEESKDGEQILGLNSHSFSSNIAASIMDKMQNLSVSVDIPPLDTLISTNAIFRVWISETKADFRMRKNYEITEEEPNEWIYEPFNFTETLRFNDRSSFAYYMVIKPEENNEITTITSTLSLWNFNISYKALKSSRYNFLADDPSNPSLGGRWEEYGEPELIPDELSFSYRRNFQNIDIIRNRLNIALNLDTSLVFDLQQYTNSNFQFQMGVNLGITGFLDLKLSATSENSVIWRYFKGVPGLSNATSMYAEGPQNNVLTDLVDSFNFFNESKRQRSGFKMKKFDFSLIHYLGDWTAEFGVSMYSYLNNNFTIPKYQVTADVTFLVQWKPIAEIKTDYEYKGETGRWTKN